jgi:hypothetical protein
MALLFGMDAFGAYFSRDDERIDDDGSRACQMLRCGIVFHKVRQARTALAAAAAMHDPTPDAIRDAQECIEQMHTIQLHHVAALLSKYDEFYMLTRLAFAHVYAAASAGDIPACLVKQCLGALHTCKYVQEKGATVRTALCYAEDAVLMLRDVAAASDPDVTPDKVLNCVASVKRMLTDVWDVLPTTRARDDAAVVPALPAWERELRDLDKEYRECVDAVCVWV